ncbi:hypothetical protein SAZ11_10975 [Streptomyces sp. FXJ1.4098]|nr:hypothetical protein [Streptomyces sp. FXJ1.4098]
MRWLDFVFSQEGCLMSRPLNAINVPGRTSFLEEIFRGALRLDLVHPFPAQPESDRKQGDALVADAKEFARGLVDPALVEKTGELPGRPSNGYGRAVT